MMTSSCSRPSLNRILSRSLLVGALAAFGLLSGIAPGLSERSPTLVFGSSAYAQSFSNQEVKNYARIVLTIEPTRQDVYQRIKKIVGSPPDINCGRPNSLRTLPANARQLAVNLCNRYTQTIKSNSMTVSRFNEITVNLQSNSDLQKRIQNELIRMQKR
ncbi:MAG: DUF4168 domain-containing protein [Aphanothece sp. CMT-3BRIN-NPC111]|nr:DUF4168 domain-containing protein [Aphanothece sp. CMT-3BRIN-NPC111]